MSKFNLETEKGRTEYLINERKKNIKEFEKILNGTHPEHQKNMNRVTFLQDVQKRLDIEKYLLNDLLIELPKLQNEFSGECYIIQDAKGNFVYGECEGEGKDFEQAQKFNDFDGAMRFVNHNRQYDSDHWKIFKVKISYEILV